MTGLVASKKKASRKKSTKKKATSKKLTSFDFETILEDKLLKDFELELVSHDTSEDIPYIIPFSHKGLNKRTGGVIGGTFCEISGDSQSGKSFLLYDLMVSCLNMKGAVLFNDIENAFQSGYMKKAGMAKTVNFGLTRTNDINKFFKLARNYTKAVRKRNKTCPILIGVDSFAGFKTADAIDLEDSENEKKEKGYAAMRKNATFSQKLDEFIMFLKKYKATFVLINQTRKDHKITYGDPRYSLAENVLGYWATQRFRGKILNKVTKDAKSLRNVSKKRKVQTGMVTEWEVIKSRFFVPKTKVETTVLFRSGLLEYSGLDEVLVNDGVLSPGTKSFKIKDSDKKKSLKGFRDESGDFWKSVREFVDAKPEFLEPLKIEDIPISESLDSDESIDNDECEV